MKDSINVHAYPGIPKTPSAKDNGRSPKSGKMWNGRKVEFKASATSTTVCVRQPKYPTTCFPTG